MKKVAEHGMLFPENVLPPSFINSNLYQSFEYFKKFYMDDIDIFFSTIYKKGNNGAYMFDGVKNTKSNMIKGTIPIRMLASKKDGSLRLFHIPNPITQLALHWFIDDKKKNLVNLQVSNNNNLSVNSRLIVDEDEFYQYDMYGEVIDYEHISELVSPEMSNVRTLNISIEKGKYYKVKYDISSFYHNIYTHLIEYLNCSSDREILRTLDTLIRNTNENETKGILVGPYTSTFFAELYLSDLDKKINNLFLSDSKITMIRYVDDYTFYSDDLRLIDERSKLHNHLESELEKVKLSLNMSKMQVFEFPFVEPINKVKNSIINMTDRIETKISSIKSLEKSRKKDAATRILSYQLDIIEDIIIEIEESLKIGENECKYTLNSISNDIEESKINYKKMFNQDIVFERVLYYLFNLMNRDRFLVSNIGNLMLKIISLRTVVTGNYFDILVQKRRDISDSKVEVLDLWISYLLLYFEHTSDIADEYFVSKLGLTTLQSIMSIEYFYKFDKLIIFKKEIKAFFKEMKEDIQDIFGTNWKEGAWLSQYWLLLYTNELRWNIHEIKGFKSTVLATTKLKDSSNELMKVFQNLKYLGVVLFDI